MQQDTKTLEHKTGIFHHLLQLPPPWPPVARCLAADQSALDLLGSGPPPEAPGPVVESAAARATGEQGRAAARATGEQGRAAARATGE